MLKIACWTEKGFRKIELCSTENDNKDVKRVFCDGELLGLWFEPLRRIVPCNSTWASILESANARSWNCLFEMEDDKEDPFTMSVIDTQLFPDTESLRARRDISQISVGEQHALILTNNGEAYSIGSGLYGELGIGIKVSKTDRFLKISVPKEETRITYLAAGAYMSALIAYPSNQVYTFGSGAYYRLGHGDTVDCVSPTAVAGLECVGTIDPVTGSASGIKLVACGTWHIVCVSNDTNDVYCWGWNKFGQVCGTDLSRRETDSVIKYPRRLDVLDSNLLVGDNQSISKVVCGSRHSAILVDEETIIVWGQIGPDLKDRSVSHHARILFDLHGENSSGWSPSTQVTDLTSSRWGLHVTIKMM